MLLKDLRQWLLAFPEVGDSLSKVYESLLKHSASGFKVFLWLGKFSCPVGLAPSAFVKDDFSWNCSLSVFKGWNESGLVYEMPSKDLFCSFWE